MIMLHAPTFLCWKQLFTLSLSLSLYVCMKQIFSMKVDIPLHIQFLKLCTAKERPFQFVFKQKREVEEVKMLIKLIPADSYHFVTYMCKIKHWSCSQKII